MSGDAWGGAWGDCWGGSWGADEAVESASPFTSGGPDAPRRRTDFTDDDLLQIAVAIIVSGALDG